MYFPECLCRICGEAYHDDEIIDHEGKCLEALRDRERLAHADACNDELWQEELDNR